MWHHLLAKLLAFLKTVTPDPVRVSAQPDAGPRARVIKATRPADLPEDQPPDWNDQKQNDSQSQNMRFEGLLAHLEARGLIFSVNPDRQAVRFDFRSELFVYVVCMIMDDQSDLLQIFTYAPVLIPTGGRGMVCEAIARANHGLMLGKIELDLSDGEVRFQVSQVMKQLDTDLVDRMITLSFSMLERYLPALLSIVYGNEDPEDAIGQAEVGMRPQQPEPERGDDSAEVQG